MCRPFTLDTSTTPATATYSGDSQVGSVTTPGGQEIQTALAGLGGVFGFGADVLGTLNSLVAEFASGTTGTSSETDTATLQAALSNVSQQRSVLDSSLSRLESASTYAQTDATQRTAAQGSLVSADTATVATQLSAVESQRQALLSVISADEKGSLFDYTNG